VEITAYNTLIPSSHSGSSERPSIRFLISHRTQDHLRPLLLFLRLPNQQPTTTQVTSSPLWNKGGFDIPPYIALQDSLWLVATSSPYRDIEVPPLAPAPFVPSLSEIASIPRSNENLHNNCIKLPPPYSWTQTSRSLMVVFPLSSGTPKFHIHMNTSSKYLSVLIQNEDPGCVTGPLPRFCNARALGFSDRSTSFWTWDKEGDCPSAPDRFRTVGPLTLHLEKAHEGTRLRACRAGYGGRY
jgi:hypothetical protein